MIANDTSLDLRLCPRVNSSGAIVVEDHNVPVRVHDLDRIEKSSWDLTLQQVVPFIDGPSGRGGRLDSRQVPFLAVRDMILAVGSKSPPLIPRRHSSTTTCF